MKSIRSAFAMLASASILLSSLLLSSCAERPAVVALFVYNGQDPFMQTFSEQILARASGKFVVRRFFADNSQLIQNEQIEAMLAEKPALMMINPVDRLGAFAIIRRLKSANVPVIFFNREPLADDLALWNRTYYVGARAEQSGQLQANLVMDLFGGDPAHLNRYDRNHDGVIQTIILKGEQGHQDAETRTSEVLRGFAKRKFKVDVLALDVANWSYDEAFRKMGRLLAVYQNQVELVICNNDNMALGALARMRQAGMFRDTNHNGYIDRYDDDWIPVVGIDGLTVAETSIADGYLYGTVKNDSQAMASSMIELADVILGRADQSSLTVPLVDGKYLWIDYRPYVSH